jgi:hypothetical protein
MLHGRLELTQPHVSLRKPLKSRAEKRQRLQPLVVWYALSRGWQDYPSTGDYLAHYGLASRLQGNTISALGISTLEPDGPTKLLRTRLAKDLMLDYKDIPGLDALDWQRLYLKPDYHFTTSCGLRNRRRVMNSLRRILFMFARCHPVGQFLN